MITSFVTPLPGRIRSYVVRKDDYLTIVVNENLNVEARLKAYKHELDHINRGDFEKKCSSDLIEVYAHMD